jgi:hypothetical protein
MSLNSKFNNTSLPDHRPIKKSRVRRGRRLERLAHDGKTFTLEMASPASQLGVESRIFSVLQTVTSQSFLTTSTSTPTFGNITLAINVFDNSASLLACFDQYRITEIEVWIQPEVSEAVSSASGLLATVIDLDDGSALTSFAKANDYANCVTTSGKTGHYRHFTPHVADALYTSTFNGYGSVASPWINSSSSSVTHYGIKVACTNTSASYTYDAIIRARFEFRNVN